MLSKLSLTADHTLWLLPVCILFGSAIAYLLYSKKALKDELPSVYRSLLFVLRATSISLLAFFLLSPAIKSRTAEIEKPIILIGLDNSESVAHLSDSNELISFQTELMGMISDLKADFDVHSYSFGEEIREIDADQPITYDEPLTDLSSFLSEMEVRYANRNTAMMILSSDGLYNKGQNPIYSSSTYQYPIYSIALGDTAIREDVSIEKVNHNRLSFLGNSFEVEVQLKSTLLKDEKAVIQIRKDGRVLSEDEVVFTADQDHKKRSMSLEADEVGLHRYEVEVLPFDSEENTVNNSKAFYVDILEGEQRILILHASPHPDIKALKMAINSSQNYRAESMHISDFGGQTDEYNLLIMHGLPNGNNMRLTSLIQKGLPMLFVITQTTDVRKFNEVKAGFSMENFKGQFVHSNARFNESFLFFSAQKELAEFDAYPPMICPLADFTYQSELHPLFMQNIGNVETPFPLISFSESENVKMGIISGEGIWRWRLYDYVRHGDNRLFDDMIQKFVQYLSSKDDKSRFRVFTETSYFENVNVVIEAEYYDKSFELRNDHTIELELQDEGNRLYEFEFLSSERKYMAELGKLKAGEYKWKARIDDGIDQFEKSGSLRIMPLQLERITIRSDHMVLANISAKHGGALFYPDELNALMMLINSKDKIKPIFHYLERYEDLISIKTLFLILLVLFATEWGIRKYFGLS